MKYKFLFSSLGHLEVELKKILIKYSHLDFIILCLFNFSIIMQYNDSNEFFTMKYPDN
jgi:hypothetical protein